MLRIHANRAMSNIPLFVFSTLDLDDAGEETTERYLGVRDALRRRRGVAPIVLAVDDAHELDDASASLIEQLARERTIFLLTCVRTSELTPAPIVSLWTEDVMLRIDIGTLGREATADLAGALLDGIVDPALAAEVWRRTQGNPLHVRELVRGSLGADILVQHDGVWTHSGELIASDALVDLVQRRIADLDADTQTALCAVALAEPAPVRLVEEAGSPDALLALEDAGLVRVVTDRRRLVVRLAHPVYGEAVRSTVSQLRVRRLRSRLAEIVRATGARRRDDLMQIAQWLLDGDEPDPELFASAAFEAIRRHDVDLAARLAESAHDVAGDGDGRSVRAVAMARHLVGRHQDAVDALADALDDPALGPGEAARIHFVQGLVCARGLGDYDAAETALRQVDDSASERLRNRTAAMLALIPLLRGDARDGLTAASLLIEDGRTEPEAFTAYIGARSVHGEPAAAFAVAEAFVREHGDPDPRTLFPDFRFVAMIECGFVLQMEADLDVAWQRATEDGDRHHQARLALALGHARAERGHLADALAWFDRSAELSWSIGERFGVRWAHSGRLLAAGLLGDQDAATLAETELARVAGHPAELFEIYGHRGHAWIEAARGRTDEACELLATLAERLFACGATTHAIRALVDLTRLGDPARAARMLDVADPRVDGELMPRCLDFVRGVAGGDIELVGSVATTLESIGYGSLAVGAAAAARDLLVAAGRPRDAQAWSGFVQRLGATGGVVAGFQFTGNDAATLLTRREREIAHLVAQGLTSREVAERCFLSVRTIDNHLSRIYDKLGIRSRTELAEAIRPLVIDAA